MRIPGSNPPRFYHGFNDMVPEPEDRTYGDLQNLDTFEGENTSPPSQKLHKNHALVKYTDRQGVTTYYDPSYGKEYTDAQDFQVQSLVGSVEEDDVYIQPLFDPDGELIAVRPHFYPFNYSGVYYINDFS
jgi:hypothetical protein